MSEAIYTYRTLRSAASGKYQEKSSKFIATAFPMENLTDMESMLSELKQKHPKARHFCYAYRILDGEQITEYTSDAGEPSGSGGKPILHAILGQDLVNVGVIVVRYFGGTKLGIPGLIHAYRSAAVHAFAEADVYMHERSVSYRLDAPIHLQPMILEYCKQLNISTADYHYSNRFNLLIKVPLKDQDRTLLQLLRGISGIDYGSRPELLEDLGVQLYATDENSKK